ncbi:uncharacterized protein [Dermacentor albipictus]|uniref:uncharacterized protein n=1 Tax=Dermacentor albipictus TaxID=60249 RepID=UPI0031FD556F
MTATFNAVFNLVYMLESHWAFGEGYCVFSNFVANLTVSSSGLHHGSHEHRQRASNAQFSLRLPERHKDPSRSRHVFQRKYHRDAMLACLLGSAGAAGGNPRMLPCFWLRHERLCPCRVMKCHARMTKGLFCAVTVPGPVATLPFGEAAEAAQPVRIARSSTTGPFEQVMHVSRPAGVLPFGEAAVAARCRRIARSSSAMSSAHFAKCIACCSCCTSSDPVLPNGVTWPTLSLLRARARGQQVRVNAFGFMIRRFLFLCFF